MTTERVLQLAATDAAREALIRLRAARGPLMIIQSAGCCGGTAPMCFEDGEFLTGTDDILLGEVEGCAFYIDSRLYAAWHTDQLVLDVEPGTAEGFSLSAGEGLHFVTKALICGRDDGPGAPGPV